MNLFSTQGYTTNCFIFVCCANMITIFFFKVVHTRVLCTGDLGMEIPFKIDHRMTGALENYAIQ